MDYLERLLKEYFSSKGNVHRVILFGSRARGTQNRSSDIDLIIICDTDEPFFRRHKDFIDLYLLVEEELDLLIYTPSEWESMQERLFFKRLLEEGRVLYERGEV